MLARILIPIALLTLSCTTQPKVEGAQSAVTEARVVNLMLMQPGDVVVGRIHEAGCFVRNDFTFELEYNDAWSLEIVKHASWNEEEQVLAVELSAGEVAQLDWELRYARMEHSITSTASTDYSVTWKRGDESLAEEELHDESGSWLNRDTLRFTGLFYR